MFFIKRFKSVSLLVMISLLASMLAQAGLASASNSVSAPVISPDGGTFSTAFGNVTIINGNGGDTIYYTTDSSDPRTSSTAVLYTGAITVWHSETIQAAARDPVTGWSGLATASFVIAGGTYTITQQWGGNFAPPIIFPDGNGGAFTTPVSVTISDIASKDPIYYTTDGSNPETSSTRILYNGPFTVSQSETVSADVYDQTFGWSGPDSDTFHFNNSSSVQTPTIDPAGGTFTYSQEAAIDGIFSGETAYYTTDGSDPRSSSTAIPYTDGINISQSSTIKAAIHDPVAGWSSVAAATFTIESANPATTTSAPEAVTTAPVANTPNSITFTVGRDLYTTGGETFDMDGAPFIMSGRTFVPVRYLADALGAQITWNDSKHEVTITRGSTTVELFIGSPILITNGQESQMDADSVISNGRTYLPARFVAASFCFNIFWNSTTQTITLSQQQPT